MCASLDWLRAFLKGRQEGGFLQAHIWIKMITFLTSFYIKFIDTCESYGLCHTNSPVNEMWITDKIYLHWNEFKMWRQFYVSEI